MSWTSTITANVVSDVTHFEVIHKKPSPPKKRKTEASAIPLPGGSGHSGEADDDDFPTTEDIAAAMGLPPETADGDEVPEALDPEATEGDGADESDRDADPDGDAAAAPAADVVGAHDETEPGHGDAADGDAEDAEELTPEPTLVISILEYCNTMMHVDAIL